MADIGRKDDVERMAMARALMDMMDPTTIIGARIKKAEARGLIAGITIGMFAGAILGLLVGISI